MRLAMTRSSHSRAPGPRPENLPKVDVSNSPSAARTARASSPTGPNQLGRRKVISSSAFSPSGAYHSGYS